MKKKVIVLLVGCMLALSACGNASGARVSYKSPSQKSTSETIGKKDEPTSTERNLSDLFESDIVATDGSQDNQNTQEAVGDRSEFLSLTENVNWNFPAEQETSLVGSNGENSYLDDKYNYFYLCQLPRPTANALELGACNCPVV